MTAPTDYLERTRGLIVEQGERIRLASRVAVTDGPAEWPRRGRRYLALTDQRLLLVAGALRARQASLLRQWPVGELTITVARRKVGNNLIRIMTPDGVELGFEWLDGHRPRQWATYRYRQ